MTAEDMDARERMMRSAVDLAASGGWRSASLSAVAAHAGVSLVDAYAAFPTRLALLAGLLGRTDRRVLDAGPADPHDTPRERLFDIVMRRFDALAAERAGMAAIIRDLPGDPLNAVLLVPGFVTSLAWMLEAAGESTAGLAGALKVKGLAVVYLATLRVWLDDDSIDMARTMAALDRYLDRADRFAGRLPRRRGPAERPDVPPDPGPGEPGDANAPPSPAI